jgi:hypothetical protein
MYADSGGIRKKLDTRTQGSSVFIGHAFATEDELIEWSWRKAVQARTPPGLFPLESESCIAIDDATTSLHDLADVPTIPIDAKTPPGLFVSKSETSVAGHGATTSLRDLPYASKANPCSPTRAAEMECQEDQRSAPSIKDESLTSLIGKLLALKEDDNPKVRSSIGSAASTCVSECAETTESEDGMVDSFSSLGSSQHAVCDLESMPKDSMRKTSRTKSNVTKAAKEAWQGHVALQAAQMQMAQYQMSQWQMAYATRMAQWQQAAYVFHASHANALY